MAQRVVIVVVVALVVLGGLFFALRPSQNSVGPQQRAFDLAIKNGVMTPAEMTVNKGDQVTIRISTDSPFEFHLHGYDLAQKVTVEKPVTLNFEAKLTGQFNIEDEKTGKELGKLVVQPGGGG